MAQKRTCIGIEIGPKFEIYDYVDFGNHLYTKPFFYSPIFGLNIEQEINRLLIGEIGFYVNDYGKSYNIKREMGTRVSNTLVAFQIPFRLKAQLNLINDNLKIMPAFGYTFAINCKYGSSGKWIGRLPTTIYNKIEVVDISDYSLRKTYSLLEAGVGIEYMVRNSIIIYLYGNYLRGFNKIVEIDVWYLINGQQLQNGKVFSNGDYFSTVFGVKYPISNFWNNKKNSDQN